MHPISGSVVCLWSEIFGCWRSRGRGSEIPGRACGAGGLRRRCLQRAEPPGSAPAFLPFSARGCLPPALPRRARLLCHPGQLAVGCDSKEKASAKAGTQRRNARYPARLLQEGWLGGCGGCQPAVRGERAAIHCVCVCRGALPCTAPPPAAAAGQKQELRCWHLSHNLLKIRGLSGAAGPASNQG